MSSTPFAQEQRVIGIREGQDAGPLFIIFGQIHGNEPAGTQAVEALFESMDKEAKSNPSFRFSGQIVGLIGNLRAARKKQRYIDRDLNRSWIPSYIERFRDKPKESLLAEELELLENIDTIQRLIAHYQPPRVVVLDLHTTTAHGGVFSIPAQDIESRRLALNLHVPVVHGFLEGLRGTSLHFFNGDNFSVETTVLCFEAGQHHVSSSVNNALSAIVNVFRSVGGFDVQDIEEKHDRLLRQLAAGLPKEGRLIYSHSIKEKDNFIMRPGYFNFQAVQKGECVADDRNGPICLEQDAFILMPLYQKQGEDGFFLIEEINPREALKEIGALETYHPAQTRTEGPQRLATQKY